MRVLAFACVLGFGLVPDVGLALVAVSWVSSSLWVWHNIV